MRIAVPARNPGATAFAVKNSATGGQYCPRKLGAAVQRQRSPYDDVDEMNKRFNAILVEADEIGYSGLPFTLLIVRREFCFAD
jgi:hypothetical protein